MTMMRLFSSSPPTMSSFLCKYSVALLVYLLSLSERTAILGTAADATTEVDVEVVEDDDGVRCFNKEWWAIAFDDVKLVVHHNGQGAPCGEIGRSDLVKAFQETFQDAKQCPSMIPTEDDNKMMYNYEMESILTRLIHRTVHTCNSSSDDEDATSSSRTSQDGFYGYCDMGKAKTPVLQDHALLVPNYVTNHKGNGGQSSSFPVTFISSFLPCHFHTKAGLRISSFAHLVQLACQSAQTVKNDDATDPGQAGGGGGGELHLYAVPAGRYFMFAPSFVGEVIDLEHIPGGDAEKYVSLKVLSVQPRVFDLINFIHPTNEGDMLLQHALHETRDGLKLSTSTLGEDDILDGERTSETGWDTNSTVATTLKRRSFDVLGLGSGSNSSDSEELYDYLESHVQGLQMLHYNLTSAYTPHLDYFDVTGRPLYDSEGLGSNRFATILLYLSDLEPENGGETVFVAAAPMGQTREEQVDMDTAIVQLRASGMANSLKPDSWEEVLAAKCRIRLTVRPRRGRAILFYSQLPDGQYDPYSNHGACPVLQGEKYAANLWIWNGPRPG